MSNRNTSSQIILKFYFSLFIKKQNTYYVPEDGWDYTWISVAANENLCESHIIVIIYSAAQKTQDSFWKYALFFSIKQWFVH